MDQQHDADGSHVDVEAQSSLVVDSGNFLQTEYHPNLSGYVSSEQGMIHEVLIFFCTKFIFLFVMAMCHKNFCHSFYHFLPFWVPDKTSKKGFVVWIIFKHKTVWNYEFKYFFKTVFVHKTNFVCFSGSEMGSIYEKNGKMLWQYLLKINSIWCWTGCTRAIWIG